MLQNPTHFFGATTLEVRTSESSAQRPVSPTAASQDPVVGRAALVGLSLSAGRCGGGARIPPLWLVRDRGSGAGIRVEGRGSLVSVPRPQPGLRPGAGAPWPSVFPCEAQGPDRARGKCSLRCHLAPTWCMLTSLLRVGSALPRLCPCLPTWKNHSSEGSLDFEPTSYMHQVSPSPAVQEGATSDGSQQGNHPVTFGVGISFVSPVTDDKRCL